MTINSSELNKLLAAQKEAQGRTNVIFDEDQETQPVKKIETPVVDYAERIETIRARGGFDSGMEPIYEADVCQDCDGAGFFVPNVPFGHPNYGRPFPCPNPIHAEDRLRYFGSVGLLIDEDAKIDLYDLAEYHNETQLVKIPDVDGKRHRSNVEMLSHFKDIIDNPRANPLTFVLGPNGNGKTTAAKGLVNGINKANKGPAIYITLIDLIAYVKEAYDRGVVETSEARFRKIAHSRVIVVDEFEVGTGKVMVTEHNLELLNRWFSERYAAAKNGTGITVLISNEHPKRIGLASVLSRMRDFKRIVNSAPDFRGNETWDF